MKLVVNIPAYNEAKTIQEVIRRIPKNIPGITAQKAVVVDDGSKDDTAELAKKAGAIVISHQRNKGVGAAFHTGIDKAVELGADIMVNIDADLQFAPEDIPKIIKPIQDGKADFVTASRFKDRSIVPQMPFMKLWGNWGMSLLISMLVWRRFYDVSCGYRAYSRETLLTLNLFGDFTHTQETFLDLAMKQKKILEVPLKVRYFKDRKSRVAKSLTIYAKETLIIIFRTIKDYRPLLFFGSIGLGIFLIGLGLDGFVIWHYLNHGQFDPYKALAFLGAYLNATGFFTGIIGLLADMLNRMSSTEQKILFLLRDQTKNDDESL